MNLTHSLSERGRIVWQICCHSSRAAPKLEHYEPTLLPWQPFVLSSIGTDSSAYEWLKVFFKSWCGKCFSVIINCKKYFSVKINCKRYFSVIINFKKYFSVKINCKKYFSVKIDCKKYFSVKKTENNYFSVKINCKRYFSVIINFKKVFLTWPVPMQTKCISNWQRWSNIGSANGFLIYVY